MITMTVNGQVIGAVDKFEVSNMKEAIIENAMKKCCFQTTIGLEPTFEELLANSWIKNKKSWKRNKKLWARFCNTPTKYLTARAHRELLARALAMPLRRRINFELIGRKCFSVEPMTIKV